MHVGIEGVPMQESQTACRWLVDQIPVGQVEERRRGPRRAPWPRVAEEVLVVRALRGAVGDDQRGLSAAAGPAAPLGVVGRRRRHVAQVDTR